MVLATKRSTILSHRRCIWHRSMLSIRKIRSSLSSSADLVTSRNSTKFFFVWIRSLAILPFSVSAVFYRLVVIDNYIIICSIAPVCFTTKPFLCVTVDFIERIIGIRMQNLFKWPNLNYRLWIGSLRDMQIKMCNIIIALRQIDDVFEEKKHFRNSVFAINEKRISANNDTYIPIRTGIYQCFCINFRCFFLQQNRSNSAKVNWYRRKGKISSA